MPVFTKENAHYYRQLAAEAKVRRQAEQEKAIASAVALAKDPNHMAADMLDHWQALDVVITRTIARTPSKASVMLLERLLACQQRVAAMHQQLTGTGGAGPGRPRPMNDSTGPGQERAGMRLDGSLVPMTSTTT